MTTVYRLSSSRFPANTGIGAAMHGGRWNRLGTQAIYAAQSVSLAALEVLVHFSVLPKDFVVTEIRLPDTASISVLEESALPSGWDGILPIEATKDIGQLWVDAATDLTLSVPSSIIKSERNFVINPLHPSFKDVQFSAPLAFAFDPRLK